MTGTSNADVVIIGTGSMAHLMLIIIALNANSDKDSNEISLNKS